MENPQSTLPVPDTVLEREVAALIVSTLNLEMSPDDIKPEDSLYEGVLGLDSIDILEIALVISKQFGIQIKAENEDNFQNFRSLCALATYIAAHRTK